MSRSTVLKHVRLIGQGADWPEVLSSFASDPDVPESLRNKANAYAQAGGDPKQFMLQAAKSAPNDNQPVQPLSPVNPILAEAQATVEGLKGAGTGLLQAGAEFGIPLATAGAAAAAVPAYPILAPAAGAAVGSQLKRMAQRWAGQEPNLVEPTDVARFGLDLVTGATGNKLAQVGQQGQDAVKRLLLNLGQGEAATAANAALEGQDVSQAVTDPINLLANIAGAGLAARGGGMSRPTLDPSVQASPLEQAIAKSMPGADPAQIRQAANLIDAISKANPELGYDVLKNPLAAPGVQERLRSITDPVVKSFFDRIKQSLEQVPPDQRTATSLTGQPNQPITPEQFQQFQQSAPPTELAPSMAELQRGGRSAGEMKKIEATQPTLMTESDLQSNLPVLETATAKMQALIDQERAKISKMPAGEARAQAERQLQDEIVALGQDLQKAAPERLRAIQSTASNLYERGRQGAIGEAGTTGATFQPVSPTSDVYTALAANKVDTGLLSKLQALAEGKGNQLNFDELTQAWKAVNAVAGRAEGNMGWQAKALREQISNAMESISPEATSQFAAVNRDYAQAMRLKKNTAGAIPSVAANLEYGAGATGKKAIREAGSKLSPFGSLLSTMPGLETRALDLQTRLSESIKQAGGTGQAQQAIKQLENIRSANVPNTPNPAQNAAEASNLMKGLGQLEQNGQLTSNEASEIRKLIAKTVIKRGAVKEESLGEGMGRVSWLDPDVVRSNLRASSALAQQVDRLMPELKNRLNSGMDVKQSDVTIIRKLFDLSKATSGQPDQVLNWIKNNFSDLSETGSTDFASFEKAYNQQMGAKKQGAELRNTLSEIINKAIATSPDGQVDFSKAQQVWDGLPDNIKQAVYGQQGSEQMDNLIRNVFPPLSEALTRSNKSAASWLSHFRSLSSAASYLAMFSPLAGLPGAPLGFGLLLASQPGRYLNKVINRGTQQTGPGWKTMAGGTMKGHAVKQEQER